MKPRVVMPLHRHSGEIHAYNLSGTRKLCTGEPTGRAPASTRLAEYERYCRKHGLTIRNLMD